uniref:Small ribosomal subunit protein bS16m n=1 Tax=Aceria tosichella TaxID=561515 RepID=A0A6G1SJI2_9ACAR
MVRKFCLPFAKHYGVRLYRIGCNNRPFYLIGAMHKKVPVGSEPKFRPDEVIGSVDPMPNEHGEHIVACDLNRLSYYLGKGAKPSKLLAHYLGLAGFLPLHPKLFINAWRTRDGKETRKGLRPTVHPAPRGSGNEDQPAEEEVAASA